MHAFSCLPHAFTANDENAGTSFRFDLDQKCKLKQTFVDKLN